MTDEKLIRPSFEEMKAVIRQYLSPEDEANVISYYREHVGYGADLKKLREHVIDMVTTEIKRDILLSMLQRKVICQAAHDDEPSEPM